MNLLRPFIAMFLLVAALAATAPAGTAPPFGTGPGNAQYTAFFSNQRQATVFNTGPQWVMPRLPVGYNCTEIQVRVYWTVQRDVTLEEVTGDAPGIVEFSAADANGRSSWQGVTFRTNDGTDFACVRAAVPPFTIFVPPGGSFGLGNGWEQQLGGGLTGTPYELVQDFVFPVTTPGFLEGPTPGLLDPSTPWRATFNGLYSQRTYSGVVNTTARTVVGGSIQFTFVRAPAAP